MRNREAVLTAGRRVLAAGGLDAPVDEVAAAAGVGVATVYRHFPTKAALVDAVIEHGFEELTRSAETAAAEPDPGAAFLRFVRHAGAVMARDRVLVAAAHSADRPDRSPVVQRLFDAAAKLLERAITAGEIRPDVVADDLPPLLVGAGDAANQRGRPTPAALERYLDIVTNGLRARRGDPETPKVG
ncbi:MAG: TetR/AcrR family transcriptional regulator [Acidimicrobiia bacterium]